MKKTIIILLTVLAVIALAVVGRGLYRRYRNAANGIYEQSEVQDDTSVDWYSVSKKIFDIFQAPVWADQKTMERAATEMVMFTQNQLRLLYNAYKTVYNKDVFEVIKSRLCVGCKNYALLVQKINAIQKPK